MTRRLTSHSKERLKNSRHLPKIHHKFNVEGADEDTDLSCRIRFTATTILARHCSCASGVWLRVSARLYDANTKEACPDHPDRRNDRGSWHAVGLSDVSRIDGASDGVMARRVRQRHKQMSCRGGFQNED